MGVFDFLKKKEIAQEEVAAQLGRVEEHAVRDPYHTPEAREIIHNLPEHLDHLRLGNMEQDAETIVNYLRALTKDLTGYSGEKHEGKRELYKLAISTKVKVIAQHGLEVRNLVALLESHYFAVLTDALDKLYALTKDPFLLATKKRLEEDLKIEKDVEAKLLKVVAYDDVLNAEKNPAFGEHIHKAAEAREINKDIQELANVITQEILAKKNGMVARIRNEQIVEALRIKADV